ncbi:hypothetical protein EZV62_001211 [Acer yangbiense]|uniref:Uncharacterized protein n=1 Tax=Acer yangbiense TaxID=1000413 RepID=A0A5C7IVU0_9ROSI|nr:hypothetical protein EZV62_001211 [Acer yangbiense]
MGFAATTTRVVMRRACYYPLRTAEATPSFMPSRQRRRASCNIDEIQVRMQAMAFIYLRSSIGQNATQASHNNRRLFLASFPLQSIDYEAFSNGGDLVSQEHAYPVRQAPKSVVQIVGSCDGLICLVFDNKDVILESIYKSFQGITFSWYSLSSG